MLADWLITASGGENYLPTSLNRTCISVLDETSFGLDQSRNSPDYETVNGITRVKQSVRDRLKEEYRQKWLAFRAKYPKRWFYLLQPGGQALNSPHVNIPNNTGLNPYGPMGHKPDGTPYVYTGIEQETDGGWGLFDLLIPQEFLDDPRAFYIPVHRETYQYTFSDVSSFLEEEPYWSEVVNDYPIPTDPAEQFTSDWATAMNLHTLPNLAAVAIYMDISGSMNVDVIKNSYNQFASYLRNRDMSEIIVQSTQNQREDWIGVHDKLLASEDAQEPGSWNEI